MEIFSLKNILDYILYNNQAFCGIGGFIWKATQSLLWIKELHGYIVGECERERITKRRKCQGQKKRKNVQILRCAKSNVWTSLLVCVSIKELKRCYEKRKIRNVQRSSKRKCVCVRIVEEAFKREEVWEKERVWERESIRERERVWEKERDYKRQSMRERERRRDWERDRVWRERERKRKT